MASRRPPTRSKPRQRIETALAAFIPGLFGALAVADFIRDGQVDKYIIGALLIFGLGALGYRIDTLIEAYLDAKSRTTDRIPPR
jgi:hypothetical protein